MPARIAFVKAVGASPLALARDRESFLLDLALPCELACERCERRAIRPWKGALESARRRLLLAARQDDIRSMRVVFYGGEPLAAADALCSLLSELHSTCRERGASLEADLLSPGTGFTKERCRALAACGLGRAQVTLEGPRERHDRLRPLVGGGGSHDRILAGLKLAVEELDLVVRLPVPQGDPVVEATLGELGSLNLLEGRHPVLLLVGPWASYREEAKELLALPREERPNAC